MNKTAIFIPVRMAATRLPGKPTALIGDKPMMIWVGEKARSAAVAEVIFACGDQELVKLANDYGFEAIYTDPNLASGSDRIHAASKLAGNEYDIIVNVQGDMPLVSPETIKKTIQTLIDSDCDIATAAAPIKDEQERTNPNVVKAIIALNGRALYFTRSTPYGEGEHYHHIGIYAYKKAALDRFVSLPPSPLEKREKLEQLRALENGLSIAVAIVDSAPYGVDSPEDLERVRKLAR